MNTKLKIIVPVIAIIALIIVLFTLVITSPQVPTGELDFTVTKSSDCLRFLNTSVPTIYVPITIPGNEQWQLTINASKMPGGVNGWTDVYVYNDYWNKGTNNTCTAGQIYPIINEIQSADFEIKANQPYIRTFNEPTQKSYTIFFVVPPGGPATFHITLKQI